MSGKGAQDSAEKKTVHNGSLKADGPTECLSKLVSHPRVSRSASTCSDGDLFDSGEDEIDGFEEAGKKVGLDMRFPKRLSCMAHTLQLALAGGLKASGCRAQVDVCAGSGKICWSIGHC
ncbi:unnamed protein product [Toxocara canis]|uniref:DOT1 domain-containing protein n=1 Tax=Toxocara canis TaxID=6265 RepID=A0A183V6H5_TOXCA|nr:unnamed protein product [Toxocara canis]